MSRTELYIVKNDGNLELIKEFDNSHRDVSLLWDNLCDKYLNISYTDILLTDKDERLWRLDIDKRVPRCLRLLLASTFDHMIIKKENISKFIDAINECLELNVFDDFGHFIDYPDVLNNIMEMDIFGIAWNQTSVCCDVWDIYEQCPTCKHETLKRDYNVLKDNDHNFLFEYLEAMEKKYWRI